jgi:hypothetical protein
VLVITVQIDPAGTTSVTGHLQTVLTLPAGSDPQTLSPTALDFTATFS